MKPQIEPERILTVTGADLRFDCKGAVCDGGALNAIEAHVELLPRGIKRVEDADLVEIVVRMQYRSWIRALAENSISLSCMGCVGPPPMAVPTDGLDYAIRFYLAAPIDISHLRFDLDHRGPLNPLPKSVHVSSITFYRAGGRPFD